MRLNLNIIRGTSPGTRRFLRRAISATSLLFFAKGLLWLLLGGLALAGLF